MFTGPTRAALLATSLLAGFAGLNSVPRPLEADPIASAETPVLSVRRGPALLRQVVGEQRLRSAVLGALADHGVAGPTACVEISGTRGTVLELHSDAPLIPASNVKLLTALALLERLPQEDQLRTEVRAVPPVDGVVGGALFLVGGGDPVLSTQPYREHLAETPETATSMEALADLVVADGIREVHGGVVVDDSRFDGERFLPQWRPSYATSGQIGPIGALVVNDGFQTFDRGRVRVADPAVHAGEVFAQLLRDRGVRVDGPVARGVVPADATPLATVASPPIRALVQQMLRESDNLTAEILVKELGVRKGTGGSTPAGLAVVSQTLNSQGLQTEGVAQIDGSGLAREDRATCNALMNVFESDEHLPAISGGLAVAGKSGTLDTRLRGTRAEGKVAAKTGALQAVVALSGYMPATDRPQITFVFIANGLSEAAGRALQDRIAIAVASFPDVPPEADLAPAKIAPKVGQG